MIKEIITNSPEETLTMAVGIGESAKSGDIYALCGELGAGKTIIAKGIARGLGINEDVTSPTFNLLEVYPGKVTLYHFDFYRIGSDEEFNHLFFEEYWEGNGVSVIEWADKAKNRLTGNIIKILIEYINDNRRRIIIEYPGI